MAPNNYIVFYLIYLFTCLHFRATHEAHRISQESNWSCSCWPTPQPQLGIWAPSATYTTAHGNARSLTHWVRPGIEPASSWILVGFVSTETRREFPIGLRKMRYIYTMEYYSTIKENKIMPFPATWMQLGTLILSEVSQTENDKHHRILLLGEI